MRHASLFSGIGGFDLAAQWMGWENVFHCEINEFCQKLLKFYWPKAETYGDITRTDFSLYRGKIDILTGGFPCQPFSNSGEQKGDQDERYLFEEMLRAIREIKPGCIVGENVSAITSNKFSKVFEFICTSMENEGYKVQPFIIPASAVGCEHERNRVWIVAYSDGFGFQRSGELLGSMQPAKVGNRETSRFIHSIHKNPMPFLCDSHYGFPRGLAEQAVHAAGNAIVPQIAFEIFKAIELLNQNNTANNGQWHGHYPEFKQLIVPL